MSETPKTDTTEIDSAEEKESAGITMRFMERCNLQGNEVPAYNHVMQWLYNKTIE